LDTKFFSLLSLDLSVPLASAVPMVAQAVAVAWSAAALAGAAASASRHGEHAEQCG
jgi:hypothetical protein